MQCNFFNLCAEKCCYNALNYTTLHRADKNVGGPPAYKSEKKVLLDCNRWWRRRQRIQILCWFSWEDCTENKYDIAMINWQIQKLTKQQLGAGWSLDFNALLCKFEVVWFELSYSASNVRYSCAKLVMSRDTKGLFPDVPRPRGEKHPTRHIGLMMTVMMITMFTDCKCHSKTYLLTLYH